MAGLGEWAHVVHSHAFLNAAENVSAAALVADQEQAQAGVLERLDGVVIKIGAAVATPGQTEWGELFGNLTRAREVGGESVVIKEELVHLREELLHVGHFIGDVFRKANAIFMAANSLRPNP